MPKGLGRGGTPKPASQEIGTPCHSGCCRPRSQIAFENHRSMAGHSPLECQTKHPVRTLRLQERMWQGNHGACTAQRAKAQHNGNGVPTIHQPVPVVHNYFQGLKIRMTKCPARGFHALVGYTHVAQPAPCGMYFGDMLVYQVVVDESGMAIPLLIAVAAPVHDVCSPASADRRAARRSQST